MTEFADFLPLLLVAAVWAVCGYPFAAEAIRWRFQRERARAWSLANGSPELRQLVDDGISWRARYRRERIESELPDWTAHFGLLPYETSLKLLFQRRLGRRLARTPRYAERLERARADQPDARLLVKKGYDDPVRVIARFEGSWIEYRPAPSDLSRPRRERPTPPDAPASEGQTLH